MGPRQPWMPGSTPLLRDVLSHNRLLALKVEEKDRQLKELEDQIRRLAQGESMLMQRWREREMVCPVVASDAKADDDYLFRKPLPPICNSCDAPSGDSPSVELPSEAEELVAPGAAHSPHRMTPAKKLAEERASTRRVTDAIPAGTSAEKGLFSWLAMGPTPDTPCFDTMHRCFPGALPGSAVVKRVALTLKEMGIYPDNAIYGQSICPDEVRTQHVPKASPFPAHASCPCIPLHPHPKARPTPSPPDTRCKQPPSAAGCADLPPVATRSTTRKGISHRS